MLGGGPWFMLNTASDSSHNPARERAPLQHEKSLQPASSGGAVLTVSAL